MMKSPGSRRTCTYVSLKLVSDVFDDFDDLAGQESHEPR